MAKKTGLGKGLGVIFGEEALKELERSEKKADSKKELKGSINNKEEKGEQGKELMVKIAFIEPRKDQPRKDFNEEQLGELADSMKNYGVLQPLLVQKKGDIYEIIAGERRWRAAKLAGLKEVPVVVREYNEQQKTEIALIEKVQRTDLNPIKEAMAYQQLMEEFHMKQEDIAARVSKNRTTITNSMRLLKLDKRVQQMLVENKITSGHGRALLAVEDKDAQYQLAEKIIQEGLNVRDVEKLVKALTKPPKEKKEITREDESLKVIFQNLEDRMKSIMGTKVSINRKDKNKGRIEIEYYSPAELERIVELIESIK